MPGNNTLRIECPNDTGVGNELVYLDWFKLEYRHPFTAVDHQLHFEQKEPGQWNYSIDHFSSDQIAVYDISNPQAVEKISGFLSTPTANGFAVQFQDDLTAPETKTYWAGEEDAYLSVNSIQADQPSDLLATTNGADYIIITPAEFAQPAGQLRAYRQNQALRAVSVDVQDIYDQFGFGVLSANAIHDFLSYAYHHWQAPAPTFVVLMGDGHYDPKNYLGYGRPSFIPPYLAPVDPWITETASDNRYVTVSGADTFPDLIIGRLSVNSLTEAQDMVNKIMAYEQNPTPQDWQYQVLAVADDADAAGDFAWISDGLLNCCLPAAYQPTQVYYKVPHPTQQMPDRPSRPKSTPVN